MQLKLKELRNAAGISQSELAKRAGVKLPTLRTWEQGTSSIKLDDACRICNVLNCSPNDLAGWYDEHPREGFAPAIREDEETLLNNYRASDATNRASISIIAANSAAAAKRERTRQQRPPGGASGSCDAETA